MSMFKVLIADDEWIEREGIRFLLQESPYEFDIYTAGNGEEAVEILKDNKIDILFTDIKMPFMDGLELLEAMNQSCQGLKVVIISAFPDFSYAKKAMENHACYYLLKPVDPEEFQKVVTRLVKSLEQEWEEMRKIRYSSGYIKENMKGWFRDESTIPREIKSWTEAGGSCWMLLFSMEEEKIDTIAAFYEKIQAYSVRILYTITVSEGICLVISRHGEEQRKMAENLIASCGMKQACVILSHEIKRISEFSETYDKMQEMLKFHFFTEGNQIYHVDEKNTDSVHSESIIRQILKEIQDGIEKENDTYLIENIILLWEEFKGRIGDSQIYVRYMYSNILEKYFRKKRISESEFEGYLERLFAENNLFGIHRLMLEAIQRYSTEISSQSRGLEQKRVIRKVMEIIENRYDEELTLTSIAEEIHLSSSYLSYLFKKETGDSLIKYLTSVRLREARRLLRESNMKVSEIARSVGYQNYSYFGISFKNNFGISPGEYREQGE